jgi:chromosome segregation ATPase
MADETKDVTLSDAVAALGQMASFFKAFRRIEDLVTFMQTAEQRKAELEASIHRLDTLFVEHDAAVKSHRAALDAELAEANDKVKAARTRLAKVEADEKKAIADAARTSEALAEAAKKQLQDQAEALAEAEAKLHATREAEAEAQVRLDEIRAKIAGIAAASAV